MITEDQIKEAADKCLTDGGEYSFKEGARWAQKAILDKASEGIEPEKIARSCFLNHAPMGTSKHAMMTIDELDIFVMDMIYVVTLAAEKKFCIERSIIDILHTELSRSKDRETILFTELSKVSDKLNSAHAILRNTQGHVDIEKALREYKELL